MYWNVSKLWTADGGMFPASSPSDFSLVGQKKGFWDTLLSPER